MDITFCPKEYLLQGRSQFREHAKEERQAMSKFFVILVEDLGDEDFKFFRDSDRFLDNTKIELPTECEIRGCSEISGDDALRFKRAAVER